MNFTGFFFLDTAPAALQNFSLVFNLLGILILTVIGNYVFRTFYDRFIWKATQIMRNDPTSYKFIAHAGTALIYIVGISFAIYETHPLRTVAKSLLAGAGILALAIGLASQHALSNIVSGVFIVIFKPFRVNQRIKIKDTMHGIVEDITLRHVIIRDFENRRIIIPNSVISQEIIVNADIEDNRICKWVEVFISYDSDLDLAKHIMAEEIEKHSLFVDNRTQEHKEKGLPIVPVRVITLGDHGILLRGWAWAMNSAEAFELNCDLLETIKKRFDASGIIIPYPQQVVHIATPHPSPDQFIHP